MEKNWRVHHTNDMFYPFCIVCPGKSHRARQYAVLYPSPNSGSFLRKKAELSFGEGDLQRRNLLKLSIKKYKKMLDSLYVEKYKKMWDRVVLLLGICNLVQAGMYKNRKIS